MQVYRESQTFLEMLRHLRANVLAKSSLLTENPTGELAANTLRAAQDDLLAYAKSAPFRIDPSRLDASYLLRAAYGYSGDDFYLARVEAFPLASDPVSSRVMTLILLCAAYAGALDNAKYGSTIAIIDQIVRTTHDLEQLVLGPALDGNLRKAYGSIQGQVNNSFRLSSYREKNAAAIKECIDYQKKYGCTKSEAAKKIAPRHNLNWDTLRRMF
jgi:hypothetical protein